MQQEKSNVGNVLDWPVLRRLFGFLKPYKGRFFLLIVLTLGLAITGPARPYLINYTIDNPIRNNDVEGLYTMFIALLGLLFGQAIIQYLFTSQSGILGQNIINDIRTQLFRHINNLKLRYFDKTPIGRLVTRNVSDIQSLSEVFTQGLAGMAGDLLQIVMILFFMFYTNWKLTLISLSTFPLLIISTYVFKEKIKTAFGDLRAAVSNLNTFVQEHITGMKVVQIFNSEEREYAKFKAINRDHRDANLRSVLYYSIYFPVAELIGASATGLLVWYGAKASLEGTSSPGELVAFIMYVSMFFRPIRMIADRFNTLQMGIVSSDRIFKLLDEKEHIPNDGKIKATIKGELEFKDVHFSYDDEEYVLNGVNFKIEAGQKLAIVGATGAGKTTIINLIPRFYDIQKGKILVDQQDIKNYDLDHIRSKIGLVLQDVFLFSDSIFNNITLWKPDISIQEVKKAAKQVGALKFIEKLPGGFDYDVKERGATLSVGQRQMISFVRCLVSDPSIIILDEATSSVDSETEKLIEGAMDKMMENRTSIIIAHRLSTIVNADKILVMDKGKVVEEGTHKSLIEKGGYYANLYNVQFSKSVSTA